MEKNNRYHERTVLGELGAAIGKGLIAGLAGTVAISISQAIEMRITKRKASDTPARAAEKLFDIGPEPGAEEAFSNEVHYTYGTLWGTARGLLAVCGIRGFVATAAHFSAIWGTALVAETELELAPPVDEWKNQEFVMSIVHHLVYATVAGLVYDAID